ncbi:Unknown protein, partial [Striga hermonthica]
RIVHSGFWDGNVYKNGETEMNFLCLKTSSYETFMNRVHDIVRGDRNMCDYRFHFLVAGDNGEVEKWRISCESDMRNVSAMFTTPTIYVTLQPKHTPSPYTQASVPMYPSYGYPGGFMNLFAAQGPPLYPYGA